MILENINNSYITIISLLSLLIFVLVSKIPINKKFQVFLDKDFRKPQAFHKNSTPRTGGLALFVALIIFFLTFNYIFKFNNYDYIFFSISFFIIGFLDDIKITLQPSLRLILMIIFLSIGLILFDIQITKTGLTFLNLWLENSIFQYVFLILCFLFIINGCNLIDGFNGLLAIHLIIINSVILFIYLSSDSQNTNLFLSGQIFIMFCLLLFNFPNAKMFMGDSGAYLLGALTSLNIINASNTFLNISPFFFTTLLFYIFFEVFFSFFRKLKIKKSPLRPDSFHLHMLIFKYLNFRKKLNNANPKTSILINFIFLILIIPAIIFREDGLFCRYWFLIQILVYFLFYNFTKKLN